MFTGAGAYATALTPYTRAMAVADHWLRTPHWSTDIPLDTPHPRLDVLAEHGFVVLRDLDRADPRVASTSRSSTWTGRAAATPTSRRSPPPTASSTAAASGSQATSGPTRAAGSRRTRRCARRLVAEVESVGADFGRVRVIKLEPQGYDDALRQIHRDDNNRFNPDAEGWVVRSWTELTDYPDSFMVLMEQGPDGLPDPATEVRLPLHRGARFVVDTQRLWHVVCHPGDAPRYALIASFESGPALDAWIASQR